MCPRGAKFFGNNVLHSATRANILLGMSTTPSGQSIKVAPHTGRARRRELAEQAEAERRQIEGELLRDLGRPPTGRDRAAIENLSASMVRARRLRADGRNDSEERRLIAQLMRQMGLKPEPAASQKPSATPGLDYLRETYGTEGAR